MKWVSRSLKDRNLSNYLFSYTHLVVFHRCGCDTLRMITPDWSWYTWSSDQRHTGRPPPYSQIFDSCCDTLRIITPDRSGYTWSSAKRNTCLPPPYSQIFDLAWFRNFDPGRMHHQPHCSYSPNLSTRHYQYCKYWDCCYVLLMRRSYLTAREEVSLQHLRSD